MTTRSRTTTAEMLALPFYAIMDLVLDLPWLAPAAAAGGLALAALLAF